MIIYKTTNLINNKIYIGQSKKNNPSYLGGGRNIRLAFKKYGRENFKKEVIIEGNFNQNLINELEKHYIQLYNSTNDKTGYNIMIGGKTALYSKERNLKISKAIKGIKRNDLFKQKCRNRLLGTKLSEETKKKMSESQKKRKQGKPIIQLIGSITKEWESATQASKLLGYTQSCISKACRKKLKYKNCYWQFKN